MPKLNSTLYINLNWYLNSFYEDISRKICQFKTYQQIDHIGARKYIILTEPDAVIDTPNYFKITLSLKIASNYYWMNMVLPDSEFELWLELTVEMEHSETDLLLLMASTWVESSSSRCLRLRCSRIKFSLLDWTRRSLSSKV